MFKKMLIDILVLIIILVVVHLIYTGVIRPNADIAIDIARQQGQAAPRTLSVILKDIEQEICIILMFFSFYMIWGRCKEVTTKRYIFSVDLLQNEGEQEDVSYLQRLYELSPDVKDTPLVKTMIASLRRFNVTKDVHHVSSVINSSIESTAMKLETGNSIIRYMIWAIPSIGFIGTVRGISIALSEADKALKGDIASMTESLGVAFNSTFIALLISVVLMALMHFLQSLQDGLVMDIEEYCETYLVKRLS